MKNLIEVIIKHSQVDRSLRYRDRRGHYASSALSCPRDMYWSLTGVIARTNPADFVGKMKMLVGSAVEAQLVKEYFSDLHWYGIHLLGTQGTVGGSNPDWDGSMDVLLANRVGDKFDKPYVVEIKTKSGYGADLLYNNVEVSDEYLAQLGLYLRHLDSKGVTNRGCLFYVLLSDRHFGEIMQVDCEFERTSNTIKATEVIFSSNANSRSLEQKFCLDVVDENFRYVDKCIAEKVVPKPRYVYKYAITAEMLAEQSDDALRKMYRGEKILGDWQARYSPYLNHNLALDGVSRSYDEKERTLIHAEYLSRHPKSKL